MLIDTATISTLMLGGICMASMYLFNMFWTVGKTLAPTQVIQLGPWVGLFSIFMALWSGFIPGSWDKSFVIYGLIGVAVLYVLLATVFRFMYRTNKSEAFESTAYSTVLIFIFLWMVLSFLCVCALLVTSISGLFVH